MVKARFAMGSAALLGAAAYIAGTGLTISSGWLITMASSHPPIMTLGVAVVLVRFFALFRASARYAERVISHDVIFKKLTSLRVALFSSLEDRGISAARKINSGTFVKSLVDDVERGQEYQLRVVLPGIAAFLSVSAGVGLGFVLQPETLWITGPASLALLLLIPAFIAWSLRKCATAIEGGENEYFEIITATSVGAVEAKMFGFLKIEKESLSAQEVKIMDLERELIRKTFTAQLITLLVFSVVTISIVTLVFQLASHQSLPAVQITMIVFLPLVLFESITNWYPNLYSSGKMILAQENIDRELLVEKGSADTRAHSQSEFHFAALPLTLTLSKMQVDWGRELAAPISFSLNQGESVVISGKSGSGKSTLAMGVSGLLEYRGSCQINGTEVREISNLPTLLSGALQHSHIFSTSLRENLKIARGAATDEEILKVLEIVELGHISLDTRLGLAGRTLSGGEAKRLAVARALLSDAKIVVLDEPTEHIDPEQAARIETGIIHACRERILIVITHSGWLNVRQRVLLARE